MFYNLFSLCNAAFFPSCFWTAALVRVGSQLNVNTFSVDYRFIFSSMAKVRTGEVGQMGTSRSRFMLKFTVFKFCIHSSAGLSPRCLENSCWKPNWSVIYRFLFPLVSLKVFNPWVCTFLQKKRAISALSLSQNIFVELQNGIKASNRALTTHWVVYKCVKNIYLGHFKNKDLFKNCIC